MELRSPLILSLSGGGVRGLFSLQILMLLKLNMEGSLLDKVDVVVGTSVGSIVAIVLALGWLDDDEQNVKEMFDENCADMFRNKSPNMLMHPKYDGEGKQQVLRRIFGYKKLRDVRVPVVITATNASDGSPRLFRWDTDGDLDIVEVLDASTAAPTYYPPVMINDIYYCDGGIVSNEPLDVSLVMGFEMFGGVCGRNSFKIMNISNKSNCPKTSSDVSPSAMGLIAWFTRKSCSLIDMMLGSNNDLPTRLVRSVLGEERFLNVFSDLGSTMDDYSTEFRNVLVDKANNVWSNIGGTILDFVQ